MDLPDETLFHFVLRQVPPHLQKGVPQESEHIQLGDGDAPVT